MSSECLPDPSQLEFPDTPQETLLRQLQEEIDQKIVAIAALSEQIGKEIERNLVGFWTLVIMFTMYYFFRIERSNHKGTSRLLGRVQNRINAFERRQK